MLKIFSNFVFYLKNKKIQQHSKTEKNMSTFKQSTNALHAGYDPLAHQ